MAPDRQTNGESDGWKNRQMEGQTSGQGPNYNPLPSAGNNEPSGLTLRVIDG